MGVAPAGLGDREPLFLIAAWGAIALWHALGPLPWAAQLWLLALLAAAGLPHGGLDLALIRQLPARRSLILLGYTALAALVILLWVLWPAPSLVAFLLVSWLHFGVSDRLQPHGWRAWPEAVARGGLPLTLTASCYPDQVAMLFGILVPPPAAAPIAAALAAGLWAAGGATLAWGLSLARRPPPHWPKTLFELSTLGALFCLLPPLPAFGIYFAFLHAARSYRRASSRTTDPRRLRRLGYAAAGLTLIPALAALAWLTGSAQPPTEAVVRVVFIGLAALTWPHVLLHASINPARPQAPRPT